MGMGFTFKILNMGMGNNSNMGGKVRNTGMGIWVETHMPMHTHTPYR